MSLNGKILFAVNYKVQKGISMEKIITFADRTEEEKNIIIAAYRFEIEAINCDSIDTNPYYHTIKNMAQGDSIWEAIEFAVFLYFN